MKKPEQRFPKSVRLIRQADFDRVHGGQHYAADQTLVIKAVSNGLPVTRLGLSVSRRVGNAVVRNYWKRRIREAFRRQQVSLPPGLDLVVRPKKGAVCEFNAIAKSLKRLVAKIESRIKKSGSGNR